VRLRNRVCVIGHSFPR